MRWFERWENMTNLVDHYKDIVDLYAHRWEIEQGYREMKQHLLESRFTLRSQLPELVTRRATGLQSHPI